MYEGIIYIFDGKNFKNTGLDLFLINAHNDITIATRDFELIQNEIEIDIDSIEELEGIVEYSTERDTINKLVQAVKQLSKKLEEK